MASSISPKKIVSMDASLADEVRKEFENAAADLNAGISDREAFAEDATGAISVAKKITFLDIAAGTDKAITLADGTAGQEKIIVLTARGSTGNYVLTPANLGGGSTLTFDAAGERAHLVFDGTEWWVVSTTATLA